MKTQRTGEILEKMDELEKPEPVRKSKPMPSAKSPKINHSFNSRNVSGQYQKGKEG